jgi:hypothetical protein
MITPRFQGGHEVTLPVMVVGAEIGDAIALELKKLKVASMATSSGVMSFVEGRYNGDPFVAKLCANCGTGSPPGRVEGIGENAVRCDVCGAETTCRTDCPTSAASVGDAQRKSDSMRSSARNDSLNSSLLR